MTIRPGAGPLPSGRRWALLLIAGLAAGLLVLALLLPWLVGRRYEGRVFPGVSYAGVALGGLTEAEAAARLAEVLPAPDGNLTLRDPADGRTWDLPLAEIGYTLSPEAVAGLAMELGRVEDGIWARWRARWSAYRRGHTLAPVAWEPERARTALEALAPAMAVPPENARVVREGETLTALPATPGRVLDLAATLAALAAWSAAPGASLDIATSPTGARIYDLSNVAEAYRRITGSPIALAGLGDQRFPIELERLKEWFTVEEVENAEGDRLPSIVVDRDAIRAWVLPLQAAVARPARDARYAIDPETGQFVLHAPGEPETRLDLEASIEAVVRAAYSEQRGDRLAIVSRPPRVGSDLAAELNATILEVGRASTSIAGLPPGRLANILLASERLHGVTLAPGQTFSFNTALGPVDEAAGYEIAAIQPPGEPAPAYLQGGIEQVATTAFRMAFWEGLRIDERHAPPYRVGWLEPPLGLDAAVAPPERDLRFTNDTTGYMVIASVVDVPAGLLTWKRYAISAERAVTLTGPAVTAVEAAAAPATRSEPRLPAGLRIQARWAREGARVLVGREVRDAGGAEARADAFESDYRAVGDLFLVGTGAAATP